MPTSTEKKRTRSRSSSRSRPLLISRSSSRSRSRTAREQKVIDVPKRKTVDSDMTGLNDEEKCIEKHNSDPKQPLLSRSKRKKSLDVVDPVCDVTLSSKKRSLDDGLITQAYKKVRNQLYITASTLNDLSVTINNTAVPIISNMKIQINELTINGPKKFQENCNIIQNFVERCTKTVGRQKLSTILVIVLAILSFIRSTFFSIPTSNKSYKMYPLPHTGAWHASNTQNEPVDLSAIVNRLEENNNNSYVTSLSIISESHILPINDDEITIRIPVDEVDINIISNINNESIDASNSIDDTYTAERDEKFMMKKSSLGHRLQRIKAKRV